MLAVRGKARFMIVVAVASLLCWSCASDSTPGEELSTEADVRPDTEPADIGPDVAPPVQDLAISTPDSVLEDQIGPPFDVPTPDLVETVADNAEPDLHDAAFPDFGTPDTEAEAAGGDVAPEVDEPFEYGWQPEGTCGMKPYEWLSPDQVGHPVLWEEQYLYNLPPEMVQAIVAEAGYEISIPLTYTARVFLMRYVTQDRGVLREATAMVGFPDLKDDLPPKPQAFPTALFLHGTAGFTDKCAPSLDLEGAAAAVIPAAAGFIAVAPDYLGLCAFGEPCDDQFHPYLIGEPTAIASLDAVRAAYELLEILGVSEQVESDGRVVSWGASQGGHAALFVQRYAPYYAPEFDIPCVISAVPPANLMAQAEHALTSLGSAAGMGLGYLVASYLWYQPDAPISSILNADGPEDYSDYTVQTFLKTCSSGALYKGASDMSQVFTAKFLEAIAQGGMGELDPWGCFAKENSLPTTSVPLDSDAEVFFILGEEDKIVASEVERQTFETLCGQGYKMEFMECAGKGHTDAALYSFSLQLDWALNCLDGEGIPPEDLCALKDPGECALW